MSFVHFPELFSLFPFPFFSCGLAQMACTMYPNSTGFLLYIWYLLYGCFLCMSIGIPIDLLVVTNMPVFYLFL